MPALENEERTEKKTKTRDILRKTQKISREISASPEALKVWTKDPAKVLAKYGVIEKPEDFVLTLRSYERVQLQGISAASCGCGCGCAFTVEFEFEYETDGGAAF